MAEQFASVETNRLAGLKFIYFDAVGTLLYLPRGVGFHYADVADRHGWEVSAELLQRCFGEVWKTMPSPTRPQGRQADDDRGWWSSLVERVLERAEVPETFDRGSYFDEVYQEFAKPGVWALFPEVLAVLDSLGQSYALGILSNFDRRLREVLDHLGIARRFSHIVISSEVGADKPDAAIFIHALSIVGPTVSPEEILLVGDDLECDVAGAQNAGWQAFHVVRPHASLVDLSAALIGARCGS